MRTIVLPTENDQTMTLVIADDGAVTVRIAKNGHNRGIAKLSAVNGTAAGEFLTGGSNDE